MRLRKCVRQLIVMNDLLRHFKLGIINPIIKQIAHKHTARHIIYDHRRKLIVIVIVRKLIKYLLSQCDAVD